MLTPPPVGYLGGGPTCSPIITSCLAACLEAGVGCVCLTSPRLCCCTCCLSPTGPEASGAPEFRSEFSYCQVPKVALLKPEAEGPWHGGLPGGLWTPDPGSGIEASLGTVALLPSPSPPVDSVSWE